MATDEWILLAQALVALAGFLVVVWQLAKVERSVRSGAQAAVYQQASDLRVSVVNCPEARPYLFGKNLDPLPEDHPKRAQITTLAEMFLNYLEQLAVQQSNLGERNWDSWKTFISDSIRHSPLLQEIYTVNQSAYSRDLQEIVPPTSQVSMPSNQP